MVNGVLLLDKPLEISSNGALGRIKYLLQQRKAGHTGTLDPLASGLLPICLGEATKFGNDLLHADKTYETWVHLGVTTTTGDVEGELVNQVDLPDSLTEATILNCLAAFRGEISQIPPMYSALKKDGKPLYEYARQGIELERAARKIVIHELSLLAIDLPKILLRVRCSKGTYIRTLGEDIGKLLGVGGHLASLRRTSVGCFDLSSAVSIDQLVDLDVDSRRSFVLPIDTLVRDLTTVTLNQTLTARLLQGQRLRLDTDIAPELFKQTMTDAVLCRVYSELGDFLGTARWQDGVLAPVRLLKQ